MKEGDFNVLLTCFLAAAVVSLTAPSKSHAMGNETKISSGRDDFGEFPALVGVYTDITICVVFS